MEKIKRECIVKVHAVFSSKFLPEVKMSVQFLDICAAREGEELIHSILVYFLLTAAEFEVVPAPHLKSVSNLSDLVARIVERVGNSFPDEGVERLGEAGVSNAICVAQRKVGFGDRVRSGFDFIQERAPVGMNFHHEIPYPGCKDFERPTVTAEFLDIAES